MLTLLLPREEGLWGAGTFRNQEQPQTASAPDVPARAWSSSQGVLHSPRRRGGCAGEIESLLCLAGLTGGRQGGPSRDKGHP